MTEHLDGSAILGMVEGLSQALRGVEATQSRIGEITGTAWSEDRLIKAVVGPRGQLVELEIDPRAVRRVNTEVLAATIVATVRTAAEEAMGRHRQIVEEHLPDVRDVLGIDVPGRLDLGRLAFGHDADLARTMRVDDREPST